MMEKCPRCGYDFIKLEGHDKTITHPYNLFLNEVSIEETWACPLCGKQWCYTYHKKYKLTFIWFVPILIAGVIFLLHLLSLI